MSADVEQDERRADEPVLELLRERRQPLRICGGTVETRDRVRVASVDLQLELAPGFSSMIGHAQPSAVGAAEDAAEQAANVAASSLVKMSPGLRAAARRLDRAGQLPLPVRRSASASPPSGASAASLRASRAAPVFLDLVPRTPRSPWRRRLTFCACASAGVAAATARPSFSPCLIRSPATAFTLCRRFHRRARSGPGDPHHRVGALLTRDSCRTAAPRRSRARAAAAWPPAARPSTRTRRGPDRPGWPPALSSACDP